LTGKEELKMNRKVNIRKQRVFSEEFKKARVKEYEKGEFTVSEICELYHLHNTNVYDWIHKYSVYQDKQIRVIEMKDSSHKKVKDLQEKVKELERIVGQKQIEDRLIDDGDDRTEENWPGKVFQKINTNFNNPLMNTNQ
jgi:transposase-like protein